MSVVKVENLSKQYRLGTVGTGTLSHDLNRFWYKVRGKEDPYLKIDEINERHKLGESEYVWALKDVNFDVKEGEVLGIIGRNGAGKSTLLKILSRITTPTTGSVKIKGSVNSLLEVGTGFHPELTGRENIYLNGAINGMKKREITRKLDEIIEFSGIRRYIDTPVKRYSSGMKVRLGFSVAAHFEPDILIVDEVLAVGDFEFQKKCINRMSEDVKSGRTVIFVSHNLEAVSLLTSNCILMENGMLKKHGDTDSVIKEYLGTDFSKSNYIKPKEEKRNVYASLESAEYFEKQNEVILNYEVFENTKMALNISLCSDSGIILYTIRDTDTSKDLYLKEVGSFKAHVKLPLIDLSPGSYYLNISLAELGVQRFDFVERAISFEITTPQKDLNELSTRSGIIRAESNWIIKPK